MKCRQARELLRLRATRPGADGIDGTEELQQHIASCSACARIATEIDQTEQALTCVVAPMPADDFLPRLVEAVAAETRERAQRDTPFKPRLLLNARVFRSLVPALCGLLVGVAIGATFLPRERIAVRTCTVPVVRERLVRVEVPVMRERVVTRFVHSLRVGARGHQVASRTVPHGSETRVSSASAKHAADPVPRTFPVRVSSTEYYIVEAMPSPTFDFGGGSSDPNAGVLVCPVRYAKMTPISAACVAALAGELTSDNSENNKKTPPGKAGQL